MLQDADDLRVRAVYAGSVEAGELHDLEALADGILVGPGAIGQEFVDHGDEGMGEVVLLDEGSAVRELHAHSFKISGSDHAPVSGNAFPGLLGGGVIGERRLRAAAAEWEAIDDADRIDTGDRAYFILQFSSEVDDAFKFGIAIEGDVHR